MRSSYFSMLINLIKQKTLNGRENCTVGNIYNIKKNHLKKDLLLKKKGYFFVILLSFLVNLDENITRLSIKPNKLKPLALADVSSLGSPKKT